MVGAVRTARTSLLSLYFFERQKRVNFWIERKGWLEPASSFNDFPLVNLGRINDLPYDGSYRADWEHMSHCLWQLSCDIKYGWRRRTNTSAMKWWRSWMSVCMRVILNAGVMVKARHMSFWGTCFNIVGTKRVASLMRPLTSWSGQ